MGYERFWGIATIKIKVNLLKSNEISAFIREMNCNTKCLELKVCKVTETIDYRSVAATTTPPRRHTDATRRRKNSL